MESVERRVKQAVDVKGIRDGLLIRIHEDPAIVVVAALQEELEHKQPFLQGSRLALQVGRRALDDGQIAALQQLFAGHGLTLWAVLAEDGATREAARAAGLATRLSGSATDLEGKALAEPSNGGPAVKEPPGPNALLLRETLRSGRSVWHDGHVLILGDVNPGAEVIAAGSVVVWGRLRGLVHAGALGDATAVICALELNPTQLRIADQIAVAPDDDRPGVHPEQAAIREGQIVAEPWTGGNKHYSVSSVQ